MLGTVALVRVAIRTARTRIGVVDAPQVLVQDAFWIVCRAALLAAFVELFVPPVFARAVTATPGLMLP